MNYTIERGLVRVRLALWAFNNPAKIIGLRLMLLADADERNDQGFLTLAAMRAKGYCRWLGKLPVPEKFTLPDGITWTRIGD